MSSALWTAKNSEAFVCKPLSKSGSDHGRNLLATAQENVHDPSRITLISQFPLC